MARGKNYLVTHPLSSARHWNAIPVVDPIPGHLLQDAVSKAIAVVLRTTVAPVFDPITYILTGRLYLGVS